MVCYSKAQSFLLVGVESSFNTPVSTTKDLGIITDYTSDATNNLIEIGPGVGNRELSAVEAGQFEASVAISGTLNSGALLELFFGQATDTATSTDYKHVFIDDDGSETVQDTVSSFTLSSNMNSSTDLTETLGGCIVNSVDLSIEVGSPINFTSEILAAGLDTGTTAGTEVNTTTRSLVYPEASLSVGDEGSESSVGQVQSFSIGYAQNATRVNAGLGARNTTCYALGTLGLTGEFTITFDSNAELEIFLGGTSESTGTFTKQGLIFQANNGVALGSGRREFYTRLYGIILGTKSINVAEGGPVEATFTFTASTLKDVYMVDQIATYF